MLIYMYLLGSQGRHENTVLWLDDVGQVVALPTTGTRPTHARLLNKNVTPQLQIQDSSKRGRMFTHHSVKLLGLL